MIELKEVIKKRNGMTLNNVDLKFATGTLNLILAKNSGGKSSLLKLMSGAITSDSGTIELYGKSIADYKISDSIGYVPASISIPGHIEVWRLSDIMEEIFVGWDETLFKDLLTKLQISWRPRISELSKGTQKLLMLVIAVSHRPRVYLLDEPTLGLDEKHKVVMYKMIEGMLQSGNATVVVASNAIEDFQELCDSINYIKDGEIFYSGHVYDLVSKYAIIRSSEKPKVHIYGSRRVGPIVEYLVSPDTEHSVPASVKEIILLMGGRP